MPLSFASILGGTVTLIGTPPNIVIATFRDNAIGAPYKMLRPRRTTSRSSDWCAGASVFPARRATIP